MKNEELEKLTLDNAKILAKLDERTETIIKELKSIKDNYVQRNEFQPVRNVVYGMVSAILVTILGVLLKSII